MLCPNGTCHFKKDLNFATAKKKSSMYFFNTYNY
ncbi:ASFV_Ch_ACD_00240 [African swine fever virus]|uniref:ASFV_Ch_ACD_00240 n=1 Tax=African swine fever virus TaxID=10497 RepID=A0A515HF45_ASF|nr:ASFV_Ch_ACD_00240 [African swine fever virus]QOW02898.1 ASFV_G_ACD_00240 [African swine fever virus]